MTVSAFLFLLIDRLWYRTWRVISFRVFFPLSQTETVSIRFSSRMGPALTHPWHTHVSPCGILWIASLWVRCTKEPHKRLTYQYNHDFKLSSRYWTVQDYSKKIVTLPFCITVHCPANKRQTALLDIVTKGLAELLFVSKLVQHKWW